MDKIEKALSKLTPDERKRLREALVKLREGDLRGFDIKKLKGRNDIYRMRRGSMRILYRIDLSGSISVLAIERRSDTTYNF